MLKKHADHLLRPLSEHVQLVPVGLGGPGVLAELQILRLELVRDLLELLVLLPHLNIIIISIITIIVTIIITILTSLHCSVFSSSCCRSFLSLALYSATSTIAWLEAVVNCSPAENNNKIHVLITPFSCEDRDIVARHTAVFPALIFNTNM